MCFPGDQRGHKWGREKPSPPKIHRQSVPSPPPHDGSHVLDTILVQLTHWECLPGGGGGARGAWQVGDGEGALPLVLLSIPWFTAFCPCSLLLPHPTPGSEWVDELSWRDSGLLKGNPQGRVRGQRPQPHLVLPLRIFPHSPEVSALRAPFTFPWQHIRQKDCVCIFASPHRSTEEVPIECHCRKRVRECSSIPSLAAPTTCPPRPSAQDGQAPPLPPGSGQSRGSSAAGRL